MNIFSLKLMFVFLIIFISGCQSENNPESDSQTAPNTEVQQISNKDKVQPPVVKEQDNRPLSERKTGDLISKVMIALSDYDFETNQDIFVNISGRLVNTNKDLNWAIIQDKDVYYFAFGHAGMAMFSKDALGKQVYVRAIVEESPLTENEIGHVKTRGMVANPIPEDYPMHYQLNTTKFATADNVTVEEFIGEN